MNENTQEGWRLLEVDEERREGDQLFLQHKWIPFERGEDDPTQRSYNYMTRRRCRFLKEQRQSAEVLPESSDQEGVASLQARQKRPCLKFEDWWGNASNRAAFKSKPHNGEAARVAFEANDTSDFFQHEAETLRSELTRLKSQSPWVKCSERMPTGGGLFIVKTVEGRNFIETAISANGWPSQAVDKPDMWLPIPPLPVDTQEDDAEKAWIAYAKVFPTVAATLGTVALFKAGFTAARTTNQSTE